MWLLQSKSFLYWLFLFSTQIPIFIQLMDSSRMYVISSRVENRIFKSADLNIHCIHGYGFNTVKKMT